MSYLKILILFFVYLFPVFSFAQICLIDSVQSTTPTIRFIMNNDGTVIDTKTGLIWKKCSEGQSGADCSGGEATTYSWQGALQQAQTVNNNGGFAGYKDWRVPNLKELFSIVENQCDSPSINTTVFPNTPVISPMYYSSSKIVNNRDSVWIVYFMGGGSSFGWSNSSKTYVRLVR